MADETELDIETVLQQLDTASQALAEFAPKSALANAITQQLLPAIRLLAEYTDALASDLAEVTDVVEDVPGSEDLDAVHAQLNGMAAAFAYRADATAYAALLTSAQRLCERIDVAAGSTEAWAKAREGIRARATHLVEAAERMEQAQVGGAALASALATGVTSPDVIEGEETDSDQPIDDVDDTTAPTSATSAALSKLAALRRSTPTEPSPPTPSPAASEPEAPVEVAAAPEAPADVL